MNDKFEYVNDAIILAWASHALEDFHLKVTGLSPVMENRYEDIKNNIYIPMINMYKSYVELISNKPLHDLLGSNVDQHYKKFLDYALNLENYLGNAYAFENYPIYTNALVLDNDNKKNKDGLRRNYYMLFNDVNSFYFGNRYDMNNLPEGVEVISGKMYISKNNLRNLLEK